jgi:CO/xanthine dehydrogenase FAD-binding subunit
MALWQKYHRPRSVDEALAVMNEHDGKALLIAGGTDLLLDMQQGRHEPVEAMVDVTSIADLTHVVEENGYVEIGAAATHTQIVKSDLIIQNGACLVESCGVIGGPQVRNVATLGGNVAHALPAADGTTALVALDAQVEVASSLGRTWRPILSLFKGPGISALDNGRELITRFRFEKATGGQGSAFKRIMRPQGVALPILACAVWLDVGEPGPDTAVEVRDVRICIGPLSPVPVRAEKAEAALRGRSLEDALDDCIAAARSEFMPRTSKHRATSAYRMEMIEVLLRRALLPAMRRAVGGEIIPEGIGQ